MVCERLRLCEVSVEEPVCTLLQTTARFLTFNMVDNYTTKHVNMNHFPLFPFQPFLLSHQAARNLEIWQGTARCNRFTSGLHRPCVYIAMCGCEARCVVYTPLFDAMGSLLVEGKKGEGKGMERSGKGRAGAE